MAEGGKNRKRARKQGTADYGMPAWLSSAASPPPSKLKHHSGEQASTRAEARKSRKQVKNRPKASKKKSEKAKEATEPDVHPQAQHEHAAPQLETAQAPSSQALPATPVAQRTEQQNAEPSGRDHVQNASPSAAHQANTPRRGLTQLLDRVLRRAEESTNASLSHVNELANEQDKALQQQREAVDKMLEHWRADAKSREAIEKELEQKKAEVSSLQNENAKVHDDALKWKETALAYEAEVQKARRQLHGRDFLVTAAYTVSQQQQQQQQDKQQQEQHTPKSSGKRKRKSRQSQRYSEEGVDGTVEAQHATPSSPVSADAASGAEEQSMGATALRNLTGFAWRKIRKQTGIEVHEFTDCDSSGLSFEISDGQAADADAAFLLTVTNVGTAGKHVPQWLQAGGQYALSSTHDLQLLFHRLGLASRQQHE